MLSRIIGLQIPMVPYRSGGRERERERVCACAREDVCESKEKISEKEDACQSERPKDQKQDQMYVCASSLSKSSSIPVTVVLVIGKLVIVLVLD